MSQHAKGGRPGKRALQAPGVSRSRSWNTHSSKFDYLSADVLKAFDQWVWQQQQQQQQQQQLDPPGCPNGKPQGPDSPSAGLQEGAGDGPLSDADDDGLEDVSILGNCCDDGTNSGGEWEDECTGVALSKLLPASTHIQLSDQSAPSARLSGDA